MKLVIKKVKGKSWRKKSKNAVDIVDKYDEAKDKLVEKKDVEEKK